MSNLSDQLAVAQRSDLPHSFGRARPVASGAARPVVLFALFADGYPTSSLLYATSFAGALGADLHVVRVLPDLSRARALFPGRNVMDAPNTTEWTERVHRATRAWLAPRLRAIGGDADHLEIAQGDFVVRVAEHASDLGAEFVVLPPRTRLMGSTVTSLVHTCHVPVLVAREATKHATIVAATDLESEGYPVLQRAATLGVQLEAPLVALHNVNPMSVVEGPHTTRPLGVVWGDSLQEERNEHLSRAVRKLPGYVRPIVRSEVNPADAILEEAEQYDADLVVVGTHKRRWFGRLTSGSVATQVVNRADRSVLVTPISAPCRSLPPPVAQA